MEDCIIYDWFTCSFPKYNKEDIISLLGMEKCNWQEQESGSRLRYGHRISFDGISIHYTDDSDLKHNFGACLEMSGQGCRDYETFGKGDWWLLFEVARLTGARCTRLDVAFDDFSGLIPIDIMASMARRYWFTARSQKLQIIEQSDDGVPDHLGISVCHGSKSSNIFIRCYDKRVEKHAFDIPHWVRLEIQIRNDDTAGFISADGDIGHKFSGVLANYLNYKCPDPDDSNKRRWFTCPWWSRLLRGTDAISIHTKRDIDYNKDRLDKHIYTRNHNAIKSEILADGLPAFLSEVFGHSEQLPPKYQSILQASQNSGEILRILGETSPVSQIVKITSALQEWEEALAINRQKEK